ncbi:hypothetical protein ES705_28659 [subsurface metagenome]
MSIKIVAHINRKNAPIIITKSVVKVEYMITCLIIGSSKVKISMKSMTSNLKISMKLVKLMLIMYPNIVPKAIIRANFRIFIEFVSLDSSISKGLSFNNLKAVKEINKAYEKINVNKKRCCCPNERNTNENEIKNMINEIYL